jgi:hypothetical protein
MPEEKIYWKKERKKIKENMSALCSVFGRQALCVQSAEFLHTG